MPERLQKQNAKNSPATRLSSPENGETAQGDEDTRLFESDSIRVKFRVVQKEEQIRPEEPPETGSGAVGY